MEEEEKPKQAAKDSKREDLLEWTVTKIANGINIRGKIAIDAFSKRLLAKEENKDAIESFLRPENPAEVLYVIPQGPDMADVLQTFPVIDKFKKKAIILMNISTQGLKGDKEFFKKNLMVVELTRNIFEHLYQTFNEIMSPVMQNVENQAGWTDLVAKDLMEKFNGYVAQVYVMMGLIKGRTMLPLPSNKLTSSDITPDKDKAHIFEGSIITWTKQIKNVLKQEPEQVLKYGNDPGPLIELEFWQNKADNLNSIHEQLQSVEVKNILRFLEGNKSTYTNPFSKLKSDVQKSRIEANDNNRFLKTLQDLFERLSDPGTDFNTLYELFIPMMHTILLIWQKSRYYNTPPRLVVLIREMCNAIIAKAQNFVDGPLIFSLISDKETTSEACDKLQTTIDICSKFKDAYFEYKANAQQQWKLTTNALFVRLDSFLERCHDILHLCNTIKQFNKLEKIELGGTKGKSLTESIQQISKEFESAVEGFTQVKYDIMNISQKEFDEDFYQFRSKIKELERRLASVITQGFDDYDTIYGRFKLLDNFEGLLNRPIIQDELEKKHIVLLDMYKQDLKQVQSIFLEGKILVDKEHENAPVFLNMPPISGALTWCKSLRDRIQEPIEKLTSLGQGITEREEYKDVQKLYASITRSIKDYEESKILNWQKEVEENSEEKLKQSLLTKDENGIVKVNFDPSLIRLLREVKYFKQLELQVPDTAEQIFSKGETYRQQIVSLDMIIQNYNYITTSMHPVEEPLVKKRIQEMEQEIHPGIDDHKWKSPNIDQFISKSKNIVDSLFETVNKMKDSLKKIQQNLSNFNNKIIERKNKPMTPEDYDQYLKAIFANKISNVKDSGAGIHKLVKEVLDAVKADKKGNQWKNYNDYINCIVIDGIAEAIQTALQHLNDQIDPEYLKKNENIGPLFDIKLELNSSRISYEPPIEEDENYPTSVRNVIKGWINDFFLIAGTISRLDNSQPGDYLQEIRAYFEVKQSISQINKNLDDTELECAEFRAKFNKYSIYWEKDPQQEFERFLIDNVQKDVVREGEEDEEEIGKVNPLLKGCRAKIPPLDMFDDNITQLKLVQQEIEKISKDQIINWLRVDLKPLKSSLNAKVQQWIRIYTDFLLTQFRTTLKNLQLFIKKTDEGIAKNPADEQYQGDNELLMKVMKVISDVKDVEPTKKDIVQRLKDMFAKLKKHGVLVQEKGQEDPLQVIDNANSEFSEMANMVLTKVKSDIIPMINQETIQIKKRLELFSEKVKNFRETFLKTLPFHYDEKCSMEEIQANYKIIDSYYIKTCEIEQEATEYNKLEKLFELQRSQYKQLKECLNDLKNLKIMWDTISMINYQYNDWKSKPWRQIKAETMLEINKALQTQLKTLPKEIRQYRGYNIIVDKVKNMGTVLPLVSALHSEFMEDRHWDELKKLTARQFDHKSMSFTFEDILGLNLYKYEINVNEIVDVAQKEAKIEKKLKKIETDWNKQIFEFGEYKETKIFLPLDLMMELLDQNSMDLMGMKSQGKFVEYFINIVETWREKLGRVDVVVNQWLKVQKDWRMLVNIFLASEDIRMQLPEDTKRFEDVDKEFRELMNEVQINPQVVEACTHERKELLDTWSQKIKVCEKSLYDYLEQKKKAFPRFYFLSNQSLLTILSNGQNAPKVCEFLGDCFDGLQGLKFLPPKAGEQFSRLGEGMISKDREFIQFPTHFVCEGAVENWLLSLEFRMREVLQEILETAKSASELWEVEKAREDWVEGYPAQIALLATQIVWTEDVYKSFEDLSGGSDSAMRDCLKLIQARIEALINKVRGPLARLERMKIINIITIDVHGRDIVEKYVLEKIQDPDSFKWLSQLKFVYENKQDSDMHLRQNLRFPWEKDRVKKKCIIRIVDWFRFYSYEYVGNAMRLVVTPLTDRCYITLTQALNLTLGGAPAGPAGTGKTETTKDLGRGVGIFVVVFNCSDQMTKDSMSQIFMGLSQAGAWGCFDEFNRISIEVLSVVATQVKCCLDALKDKQPKFNFVEEGEVNLQDTVGFFITMNPGYAGRTELPENLKALFRSCAMVVPDLVLICENMLMSEGFTSAKNLSKKFVSLYMLSRELLSKQKHYDWGLRAVKSVLRQAGGLKRADPDISEDPLLKRALRDFNVPKIVSDDKPIFLRLIGDLFPKVDAESKTDPEFYKLAKETSKRDLGLVNEDGFILKIIQLKEILEVRHCCFLIGPPGCGKTMVWKALGKCMENMNEYWEYDTLNPKAVTSDELFGAYSKSKEWKNGVLAVIMKNQVKNEDKYKETQRCKWSILDGDIDPEWIESLNTVMDDNKVLTLVSNDRIPLSPEMRLLFEVSNLKNATPATASRAGVLFINETDIGWMPFMNQWLERSVEKLFKGTKEGQGIIESPEIEEVGKFVFYRCFQQYIEGNAEIHDKDKVRYIAPMTDIGKVQSICCILDAMLEDQKQKIDIIKNRSEDDLKLCYEAMFIFAGIWSVGGAIGGGQDDEKDMKDFSAVWKSAAKVKFPEQGTCYDFYWNFDELRWDRWQDKVESYVNMDDGSNVWNIFSKIYVATVHTTRLKYMIQVHLKRRKPILFIGGAGTGKTAVIRQFLLSTDSAKVASKTINFSSFTDSAALQKNIESIVEKKSGRTYGSATNKTLICFIDDLNMPYVDKYGTQSPIQLLRQIIDYGSVFNRDQLEERKFLQDLLFFSCLNQKSGSFIVDLRLQRNFTAFTMYTPQADIIETIFGQITNSHFATISDKVQKMSDPLIKTTIYLFQKILKDTKFSPSAKRFHYQFNFREIAKIVEGLLRTNQKDFKDNIYGIQRIWAHECKRTFEDRFIDEEDVILFRKYLNESLAKNFGDPDEKNNPLDEPVVFTSFISEHQGQDPVYIESTVQVLKKVLDEKMDEYNEIKPRMQLVLFKQAMEHISKIVRILNMSGNNALLVGVGGSGKQSLTRLATFIAGFEIDQMVVTSSFTMTDFRNYLSEIYKKISKPSASPRVFMITDQQIKDETFLIPVNDMLNSGWIFDLFPKEDTDGMIGNVRGEAKGFGISDNIDAITNFFLDKMRRNMKVVLCHSPVGETMRVRSRKFPGIINSTSIDWFHPWPKDALIDVSFRFLSEIEFPQDDIRTAVSLNMSEVHLSIDVANKKYLQLERRYNYTTPKSFLELIDFYKKILGEKRNFIDKQIQRYQMGLNILAETQGKVQGLQEELKIKMVKVNQKKAETDELIEKVVREGQIAEQEQIMANEEENKTNTAAAEANAMKEEADIALQEAIPALQRAQGAIDQVNKGHITEMKNLGSPPPGVVLTGRVILMLMGERVSINDADDKVWKKAQQIMNNPSQFLEKVKHFDGDNIDDNIKEPCDKIAKDPSKKFNEKDMLGQNFAASKLCAWVVNILDYNRIFKMVKPLREKVAKASEELDTKKKELAIVKERVRILTEKVNLLQKQLDEAQTQKALVEADANACMAKLNAAEKLVNGLAGENKRWKQNVKDLQFNIRSVIGDALLASAFVSYIGAFSARLRKELWKQRWLPDIAEKKIPITEGIDPLKVLTTEAIMAQWKNENLPADPMSLENASIIISCSRWPLMVDPQLQGQNWIRGRQGENLTIIPISGSKWLNQLINSIQMGKAVMIDGLQEEIDATLDPLLSRQIKVKGNTYSLELGGDSIDYDPNFKLFLVTKLYNPHFRPEIAAQCTIINFIVTESGLEEQLLALVVNIEKNELEMQKQELVKKQNEFSVTLDRLESSLLESLASADPSTILDNQELIENLDKTKKTTTEIQEQSAQAKITEEEINIQREFYRPVSAEGAMLYFLVISLSIMDHMYQYSLESFINFFFKAINRTTEKGEERIGRLILNIRYTIYQWISRGLFERHKLTFLTLITFRLMQKKQIEVSYEVAEMDFLVKCTPKIGVENTLEWLPTVAWDAVNGMINLEEFRSFAQNLEKDAPNRFKDWYNTLNPEKEKLPLDWKKLDQLPFKKLLVLRCLRPDRITIALANFIRQVLPEGDSFLDMDSKLSFTDVLESAINDAESANPVFFILSPGADPVKEVEKIAKKRGIERGKTMFIISLGQGQDEIARRKIDEGNREGHWVMLQNIHLMPNWLLELEKILDAFGGEAGGGNAMFRLFLSAEPSKGVPIGILDRSIKLTNEPPSGLKANMKRAWTFFSKDEIEDKDMRIKSILFALCFFHSTLLERKRFGPKGWNMSYPFNMGDLRDSYLVMNRYMEQNQSGKVPLADLVYIFGDIMYGGHIVDDWDRKLCTNYLLNIMTDQLFDELELFPYIEGKGISFKVPGQNPYEKYIEHIETQLPPETPLAYGLHPNAEIGFRTAQCYNLFNLLIELQPKEAGGDSEKAEIKSPNDITADMIKYLFEDMDFKNKIFNLDQIKGSIDQDLKGPYQNVFLQEIEYMNYLLLEMMKSLDDIDQGFKGILTISEKMEQIIDAISFNRIPTSWQNLAYPSKRGLASWLSNLFQRIEQLVVFKEDPYVISKVVMISRFFNPQSFLTAIMQVIGRLQQKELNKLYIQTEIMKKTIEEVDSVSKEGAYVYGFILEGARWDQQSMNLDECKPKEMFSVLPVVLCKASQIQPEGKEEKGIYKCPAYKTEDRGNTFVFEAQLKTRAPARKWILAGVAIIMDVEGVSDENVAKKEKK